MFGRKKARLESHSDDVNICSSGYQMSSRDFPWNFVPSVLCGAMSLRYNDWDSCFFARNLGKAFKPALLCRIEFVAKQQLHI